MPGKRRTLPKPCDRPLDVMVIFEGGKSIGNRGNDGLPDNLKHLLVEDRSVVRDIGAYGVV